jgi:CheY-like chemotaxis protein
MTWNDLTRTASLVVFAVLGLIALWFACPGRRGIAIIVALAAIAVGGCLGFLFAVPRVSQSWSHGNSTEAVQRSPSSYEMHINTNLEQISDWLTKIIVGIGLSQLSNIPSAVSRISTFIAPAFSSDTSQSTVISAASLVYFSSLGNLSGYLLTRIYLSGVFRRADAHVVSGLVVSNSELREQQTRLLADLQGQVIDLRSGKVDPPLALEERIASEDGSGKVSSILWVDDNPRANALMTERLQNIGIEVVAALNTNEAIETCSTRRFDRIISSMGRVENGKFEATAGIDLIRKISQLNGHDRVVIFCDPNEVANYRNAAKEEGAAAITSSATVLLDALQLESGV